MARVTVARPPLLIGSALAMTTGTFTVVPVGVRGRWPSVWLPRRPLARPLTVTDGGNEPLLGETPKVSLTTVGVTGGGLRTTWTVGSPAPASAGVRPPGSKAPACVNVEP